MKPEDKVTPAASTERAKAIARYVKKPVAISAVQWDETTETREALEAIGMRPSRYSGHVERPNECANLSIVTLEGVVHVKRGDWIIKDIKGEFYPCKPDIFAATYDPEAAAIQRGDGQSERTWEDLSVHEQLAAIRAYEAKEYPAATPLMSHFKRILSDDSSTPPSAKPNETSGATPRVDAQMKYCFGDDVEFVKCDFARQLERDSREYKLELSRSLDREAQLRAELAAVRKSAGVEGKLHITGREEPDTFDELIADYGFASIERWKRDTERTHSLQKQARENLHTYLNAAKSTPGVGAIPTVDELWNALRDVACSTKQKAHRIIMVQKNDVALALAQLRAKPDAFPDAAQPTGKQVGGAP